MPLMGGDYFGGRFLKARKRKGRKRGPKRGSRKGITKASAKAALRRIAAAI